MKFMIPTEVSLARHIACAWARGEASHKRVETWPVDRIVTVATRASGRPLQRRRCRLAPVTPGRLLALLLVANVALVAIGRAVAPLPPEALAGKVRVGLVFDVGGKNDKSFNESAWRGLMRARRHRA